MARIVDRPIEVRRSAIQGRGVFATQFIPKGTRILEYTGEKLTSEEAEARYDDAAMRRHHTFLFAIDDELVIDGKAGGNEARFINHSCAPNCEALIERKHIYIYAIKNIQPGAELYYDYWYRTDEAYTDEELRELYPCRCGTSKCRGTLAAPRKKKRAAVKKKAAPSTSRAARA